MPTLSSLLSAAKPTTDCATTGELRDHEVYSCHVSPDGQRLVTAAGGLYTVISGKGVEKRLTSFPQMLTFESGPQKPLNGLPTLITQNPNSLPL